MIPGFGIGDPALRSRPEHRRVYPKYPLPGKGRRRDDGPARCVGTTSLVGFVTSGSRDAQAPGTFSDPMRPKHLEAKMIRIARRMTTTMMGLGIGLALIAGAAAAELKVGDKAPEFTMQGSDGKTYTLEQFKGKSGVVIAWFPKAFTGGCTKECKSFRANSEALKDLNVAYFTASVDTPEQNKKFAESLDLDYPILSDPDKTVAKAYGVMLAPAASPIAGPSTSTRMGSSRRSTRRSTPTRPARTSPPRSRSWACKGTEPQARRGQQRNHGSHKSTQIIRPNGQPRGRLP